MAASPDPMLGAPQSHQAEAPLPPTTSQVEVGKRYPLRVGGAVRGKVGANSALIGGVLIVGTVVLLAILAGLVSPHDPLEQEIGNTLAAPRSPGHPLGTDQLGRDVLSRLLYAARTDLFVAFAALACPLFIGTVLGIVAGYRGGIFDSLLVGVIDVIIAFPVLILLIALVFVLGPGIGTIIISITVVDWVVYARLARTTARREATMEYILAARVGGLPARRILVRHILPNIISQSIVYAMSDAVVIILTVTSLGFLGLGVPPPSPDWGTMIAEAQPYFTTHWWLAVIPGATIVVTALGLSLIADGLAEKLDAR